MSNIISDFTKLYGKIGLFGGSFDPVHLAHVELAMQVMTKLQLDSLLIVPTYSNPLKQQPVATGEQRIAMLELAFAKQPNVYISTRDIERKVIYSIDTILDLKAIAKQISQVYFIHGIDCIKTLQYWHRIDDFLQLVKFVFVTRKNVNITEDLQQCALNKEILKCLLANQLTLDLPEISASSIRNSFVVGKPLLELVPKSVATYILQHKLYVRV